MTFRRRRSPASHQWAAFQAVLRDIGAGKRSDLVLLTGKDFAVASRLRLDGLANDEASVQSALGRLRPGSSGEEVKRLQDRLSVTSTGYFGPGTKWKLAELQRSKNMAIDGMYSPELDELGWKIFQ